MNITAQSPHKFGEAKEGIVSRCIEKTTYITPSGQEGGYPTVVWTLMVLHVPRTGSHVRVGRAAVA